jgi:hypothetical protein
MNAFMSRGRDVLLKLRAEHRLSLEELALVLYTSSLEPGDEVTVSDIRTAVAEQLVNHGTDVLIDAHDTIGDDEDDAADRLAWARRLVVRAYGRAFGQFPAQLAAFEAGAE